jgi:hypothetical protein
MPAQLLNMDTRAGAGVIVITTKKGKKGQQIFPYRTQLGFTERPQATNFGHHEYGCDP